jgi:hypothetical protein
LKKRNRKSKQLRKKDDEKQGMSKKQKEMKPEDDEEESIGWFLRGADWAHRKSQEKMGLK